MKKENGKAESVQNPAQNTGSAPIQVDAPAAKSAKTTLKPAARAKQEDLFERNIIAAVDIGSSKICCFIAEIKSHGTIEVIGIGHQASKGVKAGTIIDLKAAESAIAHAVESAELMAKQHLHGHPIKSVYVNVAGTHTLSHRMPVSVRISGHEVSERDIRAALMQSRSVSVAGKDELIHVIASSYSIDRQRGIAEPIGMVGQSLDVQLSPVTALLPSTRNIATVLHQNHLEVEAFCATPYAAGLATLVEDEKNLGCTVIDMGGGSTNIGVFADGKLIFTSAVPLGGHHVTSDIAIGLTTSLADAERIKTLYGAAQSALIDDTAMIDVPPVGEEEHSQPNYVPRSYLAGIIQPRIEETFEHVRAKLVDNGIDKIAGRRVVLTGGASQLPGLCDIAKLILDKQVRLGRPQKIRGLAEATGGPAFSACAGLLHYAAEHADEIPRAAQNYGFNLSVPFSGSLLQKVTLWLKENW